MEPVAFEKETRSSVSPTPPKKDLAVRGFMIEKLEDWMSALPPVGAAATAEELTEEQQDELEKLGY